MNCSQISIYVGTQWLDDMVKEYNELAEQYNKLLDEKAELERKNRQKAYEMIKQQERSR